MGVNVSLTHALSQHYDSLDTNCQFWSNGIVE
jgi:hypothetical protein